MVTFNIRDFARIVGAWVGAGKEHAGCLLIVGVDHGKLGLTLRVIDASLAARPDPGGVAQLRGLGNASQRPVNRGSGRCLPIA